MPSGKINHETHTWAISGFGDSPAITPSWAVRDGIREMSSLSGGYESRERLSDGSRGPCSLRPLPGTVWLASLARSLLASTRPTVPAVTRSQGNGAGTVTA